jgi:hypothetical protein
VRGLHRSAGLQGGCLMLTIFIIAVAIGTLTIIYQLRPVKMQMPEVPYNRTYFEQWSNAELVPCIRCNDFYKKHFTVITRDGFTCSKCWQAGQGVVV